MRILLFLLVFFVHSTGYAVSFLSFDPSSMGTGGAGSVTGASGPQPFLSPATFRRGAYCCAMSIYGGARLIDREHFLSTAKGVREWHEQLNLKQQLSAAEQALEPEQIQSDPIRNLGSMADQLGAALNSLPNKPLSIGASAGTYALGENDYLAVGVFHRRYLVMGAIIKNDPQDIESISTVQSTLYVVSDLIDDINEIRELAEALDQDAIAKLIRSSLDAAAVDPQLHNYQDIPGVASLIKAIDQLEHDVNRLEEHIDLRQLVFDLIQHHRDIATEGSFANGVDARSYLHQPLSDKISSTVLFSGADVEENGVNLSIALPDISGLTLGVNITEMTFSTIDFVQRLDQFDVDEYQEKAARKDYRFWNLDIGLRYQMTPFWSAGAVVKNVRSKEMLTARGDSIRLAPIARLGLAYQRPRLMLAVDADITKNEPLGFDPHKQYIAFGGQFNYWRRNTIRLGYRYNFVDGTGLPAAGLGFHAWRCKIDIAATYSFDQEEAGVSLQAGVLL